MDKVRESALQSKAKARLITGEPGVGKTYFGCQIADLELDSSERGVGLHQKILFLTFARHAVARIRQVYIQQACKENKLVERVNINTFAGFFWWLVKSYGRYSLKGSLKRPWFIGKEEIETKNTPDGYVGYTYKKIEEVALAVLKKDAIRKLISEIYPLVIIDEYQDVHKNLFEAISYLGEKSRLVFLRGQGQCIYRNLHGFDPEEILKKTVEKFDPEKYELRSLGSGKQRCCAEIGSLISKYERGEKVEWTAPNIRRRLIPRKSKKGIPNRIEIYSGLEVIKVKEYLRENYPQRKVSVAVLASTNRGVADIYRRFKNGSPGYKMGEIKASLSFDDTILLQYGRLMLELLPCHWVSLKKREVDEERVTEWLSLLSHHVGEQEQIKSSAWLEWAKFIVKKVKRQQKFKNDETPTEKIHKNIGDINKLLRETKENLPENTPLSPFTASDTAFLEVLKDEFIKSAIEPFLLSVGQVDIVKVRQNFETSMQRRIIFEKMGIEYGVHIMTIHKAKGREFDGVVLGLENNPTALWKNTSNVDDSEIKDLYRVAISRARDILSLVAYDDAIQEAKPSVKKLLM